MPGPSSALLPNFIGYGFCTSHTGNVVPNTMVRLLRAQGVRVWKPRDVVLESTPDRIGWAGTGSHASLAGISCRTLRCVRAAVQGIHSCSNAPVRCRATVDALMRGCFVSAIFTHSSNTKINEVCKRVKWIMY